MKLTTWICCTILIIMGLCAGVFGLTGFNLLFAICAGNVIVYRSLLSIAAVAAGWLLFWLIAFRPTKYVS